jgi:hypothetical protein
MRVEGLMMDESECAGHLRRPINDTSEKETFSLPLVLCRGDPFDVQR